eukprot:Platyproteum_vivax@DN323_c0_g1_i1.p1
MNMIQHKLSIGQAVWREYNQLFDCGKRDLWIHRNPCIICEYGDPQRFLLLRSRELAIEAGEDLKQLFEMDGASGNCHLLNTVSDFIDMVDREFRKRNFE